MSTHNVLSGLLGFRHLDALAAGDSPLHRLDARAKVLVTLAFILAVMSVGRHAVAPLVAFIVYPISVLALARLPLAFMLHKLAFALPVALLVGLPNPLLDRQVLMHWGSVEISGGWLSLLSIVLRALLATAAALALVAVTGFPALCQALGRLGLPQPLVVQLLFLYRYLTLLAEEALRMTTARELRSAGRALSMRQYGTLVGSLLLRTWDRAERIHLAMCARGFDGRLPGARASRFGAPEWMYVTGWCVVFVLLRTQDVAHLLGVAALGLVR